MTKTRIWMLTILFISFFVVSCDKEEDPIDEAKILIEYLESTDSPLGKDYVNTDLSAIKTADHVKGLMAAGKVYIMDVRSATMFAAGHIEGAVNVAEGDVLSHLEGVDLSGYNEVSIVCVSGQVAGWATCLLREMGYDKVYSMKWGMCSWHEDFASAWNGNVGSGYSTKFVSDLSEKGPVGDLPNLNTGKETGQEILESRMATVLAEGFSAAATTHTEVFANLDNYYIINYWPVSKYVDPGHIPGATQYTPKESIGLDLHLKTLPAGKTIVVYCDSGQNSANLVAYLRLIGYNAKSLKYGTNSMIYNDMTSSTWSVSKIMGYDYVVSK